MKRCKTKFCRNKVKTKGLCSKCYSREWRKNNPIRATFITLKSNAKRRGKTFELSYEDFKKFCISTEYIRGKGRLSQSYTIDRIDETKGYSKDNIAVISNRENIKKYIDYRWNELNRKMEFTTKRIKSMSEIEKLKYPF